MARASNIPKGNIDDQNKAKPKISRKTIKNDKNRRGGSSSQLYRSPPKRENIVGTGKIIYTGSNRILSEVARLLSEPAADIARAYNVPGRVYRKTTLVVASLPLDTPAKTVDTPGPDTNVIQFNKELFYSSPEFFADVGVHEIGHVLSNCKKFAYLRGLDNDQMLMPLVPQSVEGFPETTGDIYGMNEGFAEFVRLRFSSEPDRFPEARKSPSYRPSLLGDFDALLSILEEKTIVERLMSTDYVESVRVVPSILHYASKQGVYERLIKNYNSFVRSLQSKQLELAEKFSKAINYIFLCK
jgi:hypothetical protein